MCVCVCVCVCVCNIKYDVPLVEFMYLVFTCIPGEILLLSSGKILLAHKSVCCGVVFSGD